MLLMLAWHFGGVHLTGERSSACCAGLLEMELVYCKRATNHIFVCNISCPCAALASKQVEIEALGSRSELSRKCYQAAFLKRSVLMELVQHFKHALHNVNLNMPLPSLMAMVSDIKRVRLLSTSHLHCKQGVNHTYCGQAFMIDGGTALWRSRCSCFNDDSMDAMDVLSAPSGSKLETLSKFCLRQPSQQDSKRRCTVSTKQIGGF